MIVNKTWPEYIAVRALIVFMRDLPWLCLGYLFVVFALGGVPAIAHPVSLVIESIGAIELLFYLFFFLPYRNYLQTHKIYRPRRIDRSERAQLFYKGLDLVPHNDVAAYLRKWLLDAPLEDIRRENVKDWLLWALFDIDNQKEPVSMEINAELEQYITEAENRVGVKIPEGRGDIEAMRLCYDPVIIQHRTLLHYLSIGLMDTMMNIYFLATGWSFYAPKRSTFFTTFPLRLMHLLSPKSSAAPGLSYWCRPHRAKDKRPVVFIHGLGIGLIPYVFWLRTIPKDVGILAVEMLPLSTRITTSLAPTPELANMISTCLDQQRAAQPGEWDEVVLIGNSYGTLLFSSLLSHAQFASHVAATILIDPVSLLLHLPDVAYNFTRRQPRRSRNGRPGHGNEWEIWWASATDAGTAYTLARRFCWRESLLSRETLTPSLFIAEDGRANRSESQDGLARVGLRSTVILGGEDCVTAPKAVASYVFSGHCNWTRGDIEAWKSYKWTGQEELELMYLDGKDHGQGIMVPWPHPPIKKVIETYCKKGPMTLGSNRKGNKSKAEPSSSAELR
ncbi:hypothetical protein GQ53DRAFT_880118 [Thozetella sp. PMI_491]|nr:hypothetical protein GQ53DRAFT_880118 [Thozetella sp. PMI_491]